MKKSVLSLLCLFMTLKAFAFENDKKDVMKIKISLGDAVLTATMLDNPTSRDFLAMMPITLTLKDYAGTEKVSGLPRKLSTKGAPAGYDPSVGDITLYEPWGNLAIFYREFGYASGLIILGKIDSGVENLSKFDGEATFEHLK